MTFYTLLIILLMAFRQIQGEMCATSPTLTKQIRADNVSCWLDTQYTIPIMTRPQYIIQQCNIVFILDLGSQFVSHDDYAIIQMFMDSVVENCMSRGIGRNVIVYPMFNKTPENTMTCCSANFCQQYIGYMDYDDYVPEYADIGPFVNENYRNNFTVVLVNELKEVNSIKCAFNTAILISNRIFISAEQEELIKEMGVITDNECLTFTQIIVGRGNEITKEQLKDAYGNYSNFNYLVPDLNCLGKLKECVKPCGNASTAECKALDLSECDTPTRIPTTTAATVPTTTEDPELVNYMRVVYVFALSNRTAAAQLESVVEGVSGLLQQCLDLHDRKKIAVRILAPKMQDSGWMKSLAYAQAYLKSVKLGEILIDSTAAEVDDNNQTLSMIMEALDLTIDLHLSPNVTTPRITLLTDFASDEFLTAYKNNTGQILLYLGEVDLEVIAFNYFAQETAEIYRNHSFKDQHLFTVPNYNITAGPPISICPVPRNDGLSETAIVIIIVGSCTGFMLLLIVATIVFRQKYVWMERLQALKGKDGITTTTQNGNIGHDDDDIIDYWEMAWEDVIVKSDLLGQGVHGQVFKGKLRGSSPGVEHYFKPEDRMGYVNCEVAIKMLRVTSSENMKGEFLREIELMKSIRYNEHIVNMLGCITSHKRVGLILEYCALGDLSKFLKRKKADLDEARSVDCQLDCTKQFLQFGWQIAHGMEFIHQQGIIHRDLAARNVLIDMWGNAKVGDFGLYMRSDDQMSEGSTNSEAPTEKVSSSSSNADGRLPIKWLAIECLKKQLFSYKSDIWSYGIVLFEMYTLGDTPFMDVEPEDLLEHLTAGIRPPRPLLACDKIHELMARCWDEVPEKRPSFSEMLTILAILIEQSTEGYGYLQLIKSSEHYKSLKVEDQSKNDRTGSHLSSSAHSDRKNKDQKILPSWKKVAAAFKAKTVFSKSNEANGTVDKEAQDQRAQLAVPDVERQKIKAKTSSTHNLSSMSTLAVPSVSRPRLSDPSRWETLKSKITGDTKFINRPSSSTNIDNDSNNEMQERVSSVSICIDGNPVGPVFYPRSTFIDHQPFDESVERSPFGSQSDHDSISIIEERATPFKHHLMRNNAIKRHKSMPGRTCHEITESPNDSFNEDNDT